MTNNNFISKYINLHDATTEQLNSPPRETIQQNLEIIKEEIKVELERYGTIFGEINYKLAKVIYEKTKNLNLSDTHKIYSFVCDYLGISIKTIKNLVWIYKKLEKFSLWHNEPGLFKLRLFQLAYYIMKHTSEIDLVLNKVYYDVVNDFKLRVWFGNASYKEILNWFKEKYETYLKVFKPKTSFIATCDICGSHLRHEDYNKTWGYLPVCFSCYELLKEENKEKIHILRHTIAKALKDNRITQLENEVNELKKQLLEKIEEYDKIRLQKSRKYRKIKQNIENIG